MNETISVETTIEATCRCGKKFGTAVRTLKKAFEEGRKLLCKGCRWAPSEKVRGFIRAERLNQQSYKALSRSGQLPPGFPSNPDSTFGHPWSWFTGNEDKRRARVAPEAVRDWVQSNKLTWDAYLAMSKARKLPEGFPSSPHRAYPNKPWRWFTGNTKNIHYWSWVEPEVVRDWVRERQMGQTAYRALSSSRQLPQGFPGDPAQIYGRRWSWFSGKRRGGGRGVVDTNLET